MSRISTPLEEFRALPKDSSADNGRRSDGSQIATHREESGRRVSRMTSFKDVAHLLRLVVLIAVGILLFLGFRNWAVPVGFGQYGHYRGPALNDIRTQQISFAGQDVCEACHTEEHDKAAAGPHHGVRCEACHGAQAKHAKDPSMKPVLPKTPDLCVGCHEASPAKPKSFSQVVSAEHSGGVDCKTCHQPHNPREGL
jgi:hypothetical protein